MRVPEVLTDFLVSHLTTISLLREGHPSTNHSLNEFVRLVIKKMKITCNAATVALFYLDKLWRRVPHIAATFTPAKGMPTHHPEGKYTGESLARHVKAEFLCSLILADKYLFDNALPNTKWAKASGLSLQEINLFERQFLQHLGYSLRLEEQPFQDFVSFLEASLVIQKHSAAQETPLTYSDLCKLNAPLPQEYLTMLNLYKTQFDSSVLLLKMMVASCLTYCLFMFTFGMILRTTTSQTLNLLQNHPNHHLQINSNSSLHNTLLFFPDDDVTIKLGILNAQSTFENLSCKEL